MEQKLPTEEDDGPHTPLMQRREAGSTNSPLRQRRKPSVSLSPSPSTTTNTTAAPTTKSSPTTAPSSRLSASGGITKPYPGSPSLSSPSIRVIKQPQYPSSPSYTPSPLSNSTAALPSIPPEVSDIEMTAFTSSPSDASSLPTLAEGGGEGCDSGGGGLDTSGDQNAGAASSRKSFWMRALYPTGVKPSVKKFEHWIGRVGFGAKGLIYGLVGGMTCASASRIYGDLNSSPQGAFVLIGTFPAGDGLLVVLIAALFCYIIWRMWECFTFQGADATFSPLKNFFAYRLSPFTSGCVYIAYGYYVIRVLANSGTDVCYPNCWRESTIGRIGLGLFGVAFSIATITQLQNALTKKWHSEMNWNGDCPKFVKIALSILGHIGFIGRAGLFLFVAIVMFRALHEPVGNSGNTISNGINQFVGTGAGRVFMWIVGIPTCAYGLFALLCTRYRYFPTLPPSGIPLYYHPHNTTGGVDKSITVDNATGSSLRNSKNKPVEMRPVGVRPGRWHDDEIGVDSPPITKGIDVALMLRDESIAKAKRKEEKQQQKQKEEATNNVDVAPPAL